MKSFTTAVEDSITELDAEKSGIDRDTGIVEVEIDGRVLRFLPPTEGQLTFMLAALGRGQTNDQRFASIVNIVAECLDGPDKDYFESRLLTRDPAKRLTIKTLEGVFEYLMEEWFGRPTQRPSDSVGSPPSDGTKSTPPTTPSPED